MYAQAENNRDAKIIIIIYDANNNNIYHSIYTIKK